MSFLAISKLFLATPFSFSTCRSCSRCRRAEQGGCLASTRSPKTRSQRTATPRTRSERRARCRSMRSKSCSMMSRLRMRFCALSRNSIAAQQNALQLHAVDQVDDDRHADQRRGGGEVTGIQKPIGHRTLSNTPTSRSSALPRGSAGTSTARRRDTRAYARVDNRCRVVCIPRRTSVKYSCNASM